MSEGAKKCDLSANRVYIDDVIPFYVLFAALVIGRTGQYMNEGA